MKLLHDNAHTLTTPKGHSVKGYTTVQFNNFYDKGGVKLRVIFLFADSCGAGEGSACL